MQKYDKSSLNFGLIVPPDDLLIWRPLRNLLHQVNFLHYDVMSSGNWHYTGPAILACNDVTWIFFAKNNNKYIEFAMM